jgi:hypothetical protein
MAPAVFYFDNYQDSKLKCSFDIEILTPVYITCMSTFV